MTIALLRLRDLPGLWAAFFVNLAIRRHERAERGVLLVGERLLERMRREGWSR